MKRKILLFTLLLASATVLKAQNEDNKWATNIGIHFNQYYGDMKHQSWKRSTLGVSLGQEMYLNRSFNLRGDLSLDQIKYGTYEDVFTSLDMGLRYKLVKDESAKVKPYLAAGIGVVKNPTYYNAEIPLGFGFRFPLKEGLDLRIDETYTIVPANDFNYFSTTIGLVIYNAKPKKLADVDGDGIADINDDCPSVAGVASRNGCPEPIDSDNDGIPDTEDKCPQIAGISSMNGCPDTDGDGVTDADDRCPKVKGLLALDGCPDSDGDGVIDSMDECPNVAGLVKNKGCPEVAEETKEILDHALKGVKFESGKDVIKRSSYTDLNNVAEVMNTYPSYKLTLSGYTDNTGNEASNLALSDKRAKATKAYLVNRGVDASRISATGYGIANPVADNKTWQGRAENRRVEFKIIF